MLYAIVSDIHANRQAWEAVLGDIRAYQAEEILCLGDIVDYGPAPAEVLRSVYAHCKYIIIGNHDAALCGRTDSSTFNPRAQIALAWTKKHVDSKGYKVLSDLPLSLKGADFRCVHGSPNAPSQYNYILDPEDAGEAWEAFTEQVCFVGHSHVPGIFFTADGEMTEPGPLCDFALDPGCRYIVNVGSVGQPRDGTVLASYCLFNSDTRTVYFRQVAFDLEAYERDLAATTIPKAANGFLSVAQGLSLPPVREMIDFSPFAEETEESTEINVELLERKLHHWKVFGLVALVLILLLTGIIALSLKRIKEDNPGIFYPRKASLSLLLEPQVGEELIEPPEGIGEIRQTNRLQWYDIQVTDPDSQTIIAESEAPNEPAVFLLTSTAALPMSIKTIPVVAPRNSRFRAKFQFKCHASNTGFLELMIAQQLPDGRFKILGRSEPNIIDRKERWYLCSTTVEGPLQGGEKIFYLIQGGFTGSISIRRPQFTRTE